jgi:hypothetical protein
MRIPTSVIVMSLVTAAPFALAVRDTLHAQPKHQTAAEAEIEAYKAGAARREAEQQAEQQAAEARKTAVLEGLLGEPGKLGAYLDYLTLGATREQVDAIAQRIEADHDLLDVSPTYDTADKVTALRVVFSDCIALGHAVHTQWGEGNRWVDAATHVKTTLDDNESCSIEQHRYVDMQQFLDKTTTASIPLAALGKPSSPLLADLNDFNRPGLANTGEPTIDVTVGDNAKITAMEVSFEADVEADAPIRARLDQLLGKGTQDPDTGEWSWKGKIPVHYSYSDAHVDMVIGQP